MRHALRPPLRVEGLPDSDRRPFFLGYAANLSESGIFVQCSKPRPEGTVLRIALHLPSNPGGVLIADAEVCRVQPYAGRCGPAAGMGLRLLDVDDAARGLLQRYVRLLAQGDIACGAAPT